MDVDDYVPSDNEDNVPSDIEDNDDDMSVETNKPVKSIPVPVDDNDIVDDDDDEDDESIMESDMDEYGEEGILERDDNNEIPEGTNMFAMGAYDSDEDSDKDSDEDDLQKFNNTDKNVSSVTKSKIDWDKYTKEQKLEKELQANRKDGYLVKQKFLANVEEKEH